MKGDWEQSASPLLRWKWFWTKRGNKAVSVWIKIQIDAILKYGNKDPAVGIFLPKVLRRLASAISCQIIFGGLTFCRHNAKLYKWLRGSWITGGCQTVSWSDLRMAILMTSNQSSSLYTNVRSRFPSFYIVNCNTAVPSQAEEPPSAYEWGSYWMKWNLHPPNHGKSLAVNVVCILSATVWHSAISGIGWDVQFLLAAQQSILGGRRKQTGNNPFMSVFQLKVNFSLTVFSHGFFWVNQQRKQRRENVHQKT